MRYLTFAEYEVMGGRLDATAFNRAIIRSETAIDKATHNRLKTEETVRECVKALAFELVEVFGAETTESANIKSMSNDGISITFNGAGEKKTQIASIIKDYLGNETTASGVFLLYAGVE